MRWAVGLLAAMMLGAAAAELAAAEGPFLVVERCAVFDPESGKLLPERSIVIRGDTILAVAGSGDALEVSGDATRIDGRGRFALPGKLADIVLLTADPLQDIRHTRKIELVIRGGGVCRPAEVLKLVSRD